MSFKGQSYYGMSHFGMLNNYHPPYGCHLKDKAIME
jgi:hypothetical protein